MFTLKKQYNVLSCSKTPDNNESRLSLQYCISVVCRTDSTVKLPLLCLAKKSIDFRKTLLNLFIL